MWHPKHKQVVELFQEHPDDPDLQAAVVEVDKREKWAVSSYRPYPIQETVHKSDKSIVFFFGGNRVGKTQMGAAEMVWYLLGDHPFKEIKPPISAWACCLSTDVQMEASQPKIMALLPQEEIRKIYYLRNGIIQRIELKNGSNLTFKSYEQGAEKFQSAGKDIIWFDEEPPQDIFKESIIRREAGKDLKVICTMTPVNGLTWTYYDVFRNPAKNTEWYLASWNDNIYLTEEQKEEMRSQYSEDELVYREKGGFIHLSGQVYKSFDPSKHIIEDYNVEPDDEIYRSMDFGATREHPFACAWVALRPNGQYVVFQEEVIYGSIGFEQLIGRVSELSEGFIVRSSYGDPARPDWIDEFNRAGVYMVKPQKDVPLGISKVQQVLDDRTPQGEPRLVFTKNCPIAIEEMINYRWDKKLTAQGQQRPLKKNDHVIDAIRYLLYTISQPLQYDDYEEVNQRYDPYTGIIL